MVFGERHRRHVLLSYTSSYYIKRHAHPLAIEQGLNRHPAPPGQADAFSAANSGWTASAVRPDLICDSERPHSLRLDFRREQLAEVFVDLTDHIRISTE